MRWGPLLGNPKRHALGLKEGARCRELVTGPRASGYARAMFQAPKEEQQSRKPVRPMKVWESAVERKIREAQERGDFDNLPGRGRPLQGEPWEGEWGMAHHLLKQAGMTLPWIALGQDIEAQQRRLREFLEKTRASLQEPRGRPGLETQRERARARYLEMAADLDRMLLEYSFLIPTGRLDRGRLPRHIAERQFDEFCPAD